MRANTDPTVVLPASPTNGVKQTLKKEIFNMLCITSFVQAVPRCWNWNWSWEEARNLDLTMVRARFQIKPWMVQMQQVRNTQSKHTQPVSDILVCRMDRISRLPLVSVQHCLIEILSVVQQQLLFTTTVFYKHLVFAGITCTDPFTLKHTRVVQ